jgi:uncharacterized protein
MMRPFSSYCAILHNKLATCIRHTQILLAASSLSRYKADAALSLIPPLEKERDIMAGKFELKKSKNDKFFFRLLAGNGQIIMTSEMYETKASAQNGIASVQKNAAEISRFEKLTGKDGSPYFVLKAGNHQVVGQSQMYASESARDSGMESCKNNAPGATIDDQT